MGTARVTFIVDDSGTIEDIIQKVDTRDHAAQILGDRASKAKPATKVAKSSRKRRYEESQKKSRYFNSLLASAI